MNLSTTIQRLCLFFFALLLAAPAVAADYSSAGLREIPHETFYDRAGYEIFRSRNLGKHKNVTELKQGHVTLEFSSCKTTGGTGSSAIYELAKGSVLSVKADDGYAIRWIILRDTEGGKDYDHPDGIKRISQVTPDYDYYFEKNSISNSEISGGNQNDLNDDNNNIVVYERAATSQTITIYTHNNPKWGQFKVRDIIVGYVKSPKVSFEKEQYDFYAIPRALYTVHPNINTGGHPGDINYSLSGNDGIVTNLHNGSLDILHRGRVVFTATFGFNHEYGTVKCSTIINVIRDRVTFTAEGLPDVLFSNESYNLREYLKRKAQSGHDFYQYNSEFSVISSNPDVLRYDSNDRWLKFGGTSGEATITLKQEQNNYYEATTFSHTFIVARRDQDGTILIKDANEWKVFCKLVNEKGMTNLNARLEADIDLGGDIAMVGNGDHKYSGTFDGQNHTLTMNWNAGNTKDIAPFKKVNGATIRNLHTKGQITSSSYYLSGLIDEAFGKTTITGCISEVNITSSYNEGSSDVAGMAAYIYSGSVVTFDDCIVKGTLKATTNEGKKAVSGFVHGQHGTCTLNNCLYIGENNATAGNTFAANATIKNCYYLNACGTTQGEQVTKDQLKNGYVVYKLQNGRNEQVWGQELYNENMPLLTTDNAKHVYEVRFTYNNSVKATRYATKGRRIYGYLPIFTAKEFLGNSYNKHNYYTFALEGDFNESTPINADQTVAVTFNKKDYYEITSKDDWNAFCGIVNGGQNAVDAKMTADVDLGNEIVMVGGRDNKYAGTFDGQGHALTVNWKDDYASQKAPFYYVDGATIKNLRIKGEILCNYELAGLIYSVYGYTTVLSCVSEVNIKGGSDLVGMIYRVDPRAKLTMTDCVVKGNITATTDIGKKYIAGFIWYLLGGHSLTNCLYIGTHNATEGYTFGGGYAFKNCYYLNACGKTHGTKVTLAQLKNGEVAKKLQGKRTDKCYWAQLLGEMPGLYCATDKSKTNYVYYDTANSRWACEDFRLTDGTPLPIGLDFTATKATYERPFSSKNNATLCLPYDLPVQGFKAYTLSGGNNSAVYFADAKDKLEAYKPYLLTADGTPQLDGYNLQVKAYKTDDLKQTAGAFSFIGTVADVDNATAAAANAYILQDDGKFHKVTTENTEAIVPPYRAYITTSSAGARMLDIILNGETTGINGVETTDDSTVRYYDLQGRYIGNTLKNQPNGLYIGNGKKIMKK